MLGTKLSTCCVVIGFAFAAACSSSSSETAAPPAEDAGVTNPGIEGGPSPTEGGTAETGTTGIGPAGGTVTGPDGSQVVIPPGALATNVDIKIEATSAADTPPDVRGVKIVGPKLSFLPHGTTFSAPVTVRVPFTAAQVPQGQPLIMLTAAAGGPWTQVKDATTGSGFLEAQVTHFSPFAPGAPTTFRTIHKTCGLDYYGDLWCWGGDYPANFPSPAWNFPHQVPLGAALSQVAIGSDSICGVGPLDRVHCLGIYVGDGVDHRGGNEQTTLVAIDSTLSFSQVSGIHGHFCAIAQTTGALFCWGDNTRGQLGQGPLSVGSETYYKSPVQPIGLESTSWVSVGAGGQFTCGVTAASDLYCWGDALHGQLGNGAGSYSGTPVKVGTGYVAVFAGNTHSCAITGAGEAFCFGDNLYGQIGDGTGCAGATPCANSIKMPTKVVGHTFTSTPGSMVVMGDVTCGHTTAAQTLCWGNTSHGQVGDGQTPAAPFQQLTPTPVAGNLDFPILSGSGGFARCGISSAGGTYCWGEHTDGDLGDGSPPDDQPHPTPVKVQTTALPPPP